MASIVVEICFRDFLRIVCQRFAVAAPVYGAPVENDGLFSTYVEVEVPKGDDVTEKIRCWGAPYVSVDQTEEDAACRVIMKLREEFGFEVKDINLEEKKFFENLYERVAADHDLLRSKYKRLKRDYSLLKRYYTSLLAEKERLLSNRKKLKENLSKCFALVKHPTVGVVHPCGSVGVPEEDPAAPPGYYGDQD